MSKNKIIIANWKMKLNLEETAQLTNDFKKEFTDFNKEGDVVICPNLISLAITGKEIKNSKLKLGAQNVFWEEKGSYTGEVSPDMIKSAGSQYVLIGHSERRKYLLENYEMIHQKVKAVLNIGGVTPVVCIGEQAEDRKTDKRDFILIHQIQQALGGIDIMKNEEIILAYEPVWAIGSGVPIEPAEAEYAHKIIKLALNDIFGMNTVSNNFRIIYGGSISSKNVKNFVDLDNIDGLLVGGASLEAKEFRTIADIILEN